jgi:N-acetylmuramoyl-L-alanine amidase
MAKVFIGAGHGGSDPGAIGIGGIKEKDLNLSIALACNDVLIRHGVNTMLSRHKDEDDPYSETFKQCNEYAPDCAVEIHNNAGGGDGAEVYHSKRDSSDDALARNVLDAITATGQNSRGLKTRELSDGRAYYAWIRNLNCPAVLVECAFLDTKDIEIIDTPAEQKAMGVCIAKGILKTLGIAYKEEEPKPADVAYTVQVGVFSSRENAEVMKSRLIGYGFPAFIVEAGSGVPVEESKAEKPFAAGDIVNFSGGLHYTSANSTTGYHATAGLAKISRIVEGAKHPFHLITESKSNVWGWVDAETVSR